MQQGDARSTGFFPGSLPILASIAIACLSQTSAVYSQIAADGTLSTNVTTTNNLNFTINDGNRSGNNLFHSFREFSVPTGGEAFFNNSPEIENIFSRVTGGTISNIDGSLRANGNANLFLLNPSGIIFGPNARLNIGGSFLATTASSFKFADGVEFSATNPQAAPLLSINVPIGLQIGANPGSIVNHSIATDSNNQPVGLQVQSGRSLALLGGDVTQEGGRLDAPGGRIELAGIASAGIVGLAVNGNILSLSFPGQGTRANVTLTDDARVNVRSLGGGDIVVNANNFTAVNGGRLVAGTEGTGNGGDITVNANNFSISGVGMLSQAGSGLYNTVFPDASGNAGNIFVNTRSFSASSGATVRSTTIGAGNAGDVRIVSTDLVELTGGEIATIADESSRGDAGDISITTGTYLASGKQGYLWSGTFNGGRNGGNITLTADSVTLLNGSTIDASNLRGSGNAGNVEINARNDVNFSGDSYISTVAAGQGNAGNVMLQAGGSVALVNGDIDSSAFLGTAGRGGDISIRARSLSMTDGAKLGAFAAGQSQVAGNITVQTSDFVTLDNDSRISGFASGTGSGGNILIETGRLNVLNGSWIFAPVTGDKPAGQLTVNASQSVEVAGVILENGLFSRSSISIETLGAGNAGTLTINTRRLIVRDGADIATSSLSNSSGTGGNLVVNASESVEVIGTRPDGLSPSSISAYSGGRGAAGNITITTGRLIVQDGGEVAAFTTGSGQGGTLAVNASESVEVIGTRPNGVFGSSLTTESAGMGVAGSLRITTGRLIVRDGGEISASTLGEGIGGTLEVNASESVEVIGAGARGLGSNLATQTLGEKRAGNLTIYTGELIVRDAGRVTVNSTGTGRAGDLEVEADSIGLDRGAIIGESALGGDGANITLRSQSLLLLRRHSNISTTAGTFGTGGTGGNIIIDTPNLVALENSDITANAFRGDGGQVNITAQAIFGTEFRPPPILDTPESDITASSRFGRQGEVTINTPDVNPSSGLIELPHNFADATRLIVDRCAPVRHGSSFVVTGRGGISPSPNESFSGETVLVDLVTLDTEEQGSRGNTEEPLVTSATTTDAQLVEATGWIINEKGQVVLIASAPTATPYLMPVGCVSDSVT
ncbi:MAG TPA: hypothetical protein DD990_18460, partial [Cyanobacteria bacterium UBA11368]|nr:hypothetical protein [Cyanobacteria bacterium UBA11368]